jgi:hypothetical protein
MQRDIIMIGAKDIKAMSFFAFAAKIIKRVDFFENKRRKIHAKN